ncbi:hypothetical protein LX99_02234 [Mucilaginibacter oryzae]|uniref:Phosphoribosylpyrophosphate synthetase n=1 Tax=Mucilaginibacter oryzae TaxID=468058 RepID=A0A316HEG6_9SPHI|nr:hypothetical protein [Mucilaginibacter oryzae]PWK78390.1 hypothetical protein LX99_02234 [Mucilaginibacter oryzae]
MKHNYKLIDVITDLQERGFNHDFVIEKEYIRCLQHNELISPDDFEISETYHCGSKDGDNLVYAIRLSNYDVSGILMSSYRTYIRGMSIRLWSKFNNVIKLSLTAAK